MKPSTMKPVHQSMRGVKINMDELRKENESSVALNGRGGQRMNARGDTMVNGGRVDRKREQIDQDYNTQLQGNAKRVDVRAVQPDVFETPQQVMERLAAEKKQAAQAAAQAATQVAPAPTEATANVDQPKNVIPKDRARKLIEKED